MLQVYVELPTSSGSSRTVLEDVPLAKLRDKNAIASRNPADAGQNRTGEAAVIITASMLETYLQSRLRLTYHLKREDFSQHSLVFREAIPPHLLAGQQTHARIGPGAMQQMMDCEEVSLGPTEDVLRRLSRLRGSVANMHLTVAYVPARSRSRTLITGGGATNPAGVAREVTMPDTALLSLRALSLHAFVQRPINATIDQRLLMRCVVDREYAKARMCGFVDILHPASDSWQERFIVVTEHHVAVFVVTDAKGLETSKKDATSGLRPRETINLRGSGVSVSVVGSKEWQLYAQDRLFSFRAAGTSEMLAWVACFAEQRITMSDNMLLNAPDASTGADVAIQSELQNHLVKNLSSVRNILHHSVLRDKLQYFAKQVGSENLFLLWINCRAYELAHPMTPLVTPWLAGCANWADQCKPEHHFTKGIPLREVIDYLDLEDVVYITFHAASIFARFLSVDSPNPIEIPTDLIMGVKDMLIAAFTSQRDADVLSDVHSKPSIKAIDTVVMPPPDLFYDIRCFVELSIESTVFHEYCLQFVRLITPVDKRAQNAVVDQSGDAKHSNRKLSAITEGNRPQRGRRSFYQQGDRSYSMSAGDTKPGDGVHPRSNSMSKASGRLPPQVPPPARRDSSVSRRASNVERKLQRDSPLVLPPNSAVLHSASVFASQQTLEDSVFAVNDRSLSPLSAGSAADSVGPGTKFRSRSASLIQSMLDTRGQSHSPTSVRRGDTPAATRLPGEDYAKHQHVGSFSSFTSTLSIAPKLASLPTSPAGYLDVASFYASHRGDVMSMLQLIAPVQIQQWRKRWDSARGIRRRFNAVTAIALNGAQEENVNNNGGTSVPTCSRTHASVFGIPVQANSSEQHRRVSECMFHAAAQGRRMDDDADDPDDASAVSVDSNIDAAHMLADERPSPFVYTAGVDVDQQILLKIMDKFKVLGKDAAPFLQPEIILPQESDSNKNSRKHSVARTTSIFLNVLDDDTRLHPAMWLGSRDQILEEDADSSHADSMSESGASTATGSKAHVEGVEAPFSKYPDKTRFRSARFSIRSPSSIHASTWASLWLPRTGALVNQLVDSLCEPDKIFSSPRLLTKSSDTRTFVELTTRDSLFRLQDAASQSLMVTSELSYLTYSEELAATRMTQDHVANAATKSVDRGSPATATPTARSLFTEDPTSGAAFRRQSDTHNVLDDSEFSDLFGFPRKATNHTSESYLASTLEWSALEFQDLLLRGEDQGDVDEYPILHAASDRSLDKKLRRVANLSPQTITPGSGKPASGMHAFASAAAIAATRKAAAIYRPLVGLCYVVPLRIQQRRQKQLDTVMLGIDATQQHVSLGTATSGIQATYVMEAEEAVRDSQISVPAARKSRVSKMVHNGGPSGATPAPVTPPVLTISVDGLPLLPLRVVKSGWLRVSWNDAIARVMNIIGETNWLQGVNGGFRRISFTDFGHPTDLHVHGSPRECRLEVDFDKCLRAVISRASGSSSIPSAGPATQRSRGQDARRKSLADEAYFGKALDGLEPRTSKRGILHLFTANKVEEAPKTPKTPVGTPRVALDTSIPATAQATVPSEGLLITSNWATLYAVLYSDGTLALSEAEVDHSERTMFAFCASYFSPLQRASLRSPYIGALSVAQMLDVSPARDIAVPSHAIEIVSSRGYFNVLPVLAVESQAWIRALRGVALSPDCSYVGSLENGARFIGGIGPCPTAPHPGEEIAHHPLLPTEVVKRVLSKPSVSDASGSQIRTANMREAVLQKKGRYGGNWQPRNLRVMMSFVAKRFPVVDSPSISASIVGGAAAPFPTPHRSLSAREMGKGAFSPGRRLGKLETVGETGQSATLSEIAAQSVADVHRAVRSWARIIADIVCPGFVDVYALPLITGSATAVNVSAWTLQALVTAGHSQVMESAVSRRVADSLPLCARLLIKIRQLKGAASTSSDLIEEVLGDIPYNQLTGFEVAGLYTKESAAGGPPVLRGSIPIIHNGISRIQKVQAVSVIVTPGDSAPRLGTPRTTETLAGDSAASRIATGLRRMLGLMVETPLSPDNLSSATGIPKCQFEITTADRVWEFATQDVFSNVEWLMLLRLFSTSRAESFRRKLVEISSKPYGSVIHGDKPPADDGSGEVHTVPTSWLALLAGTRTHSFTFRRRESSSSSSSSLQPVLAATALSAPSLVTTPGKNTSSAT